MGSCWRIGCSRGKEKGSGRAEGGFLWGGGEGGDDTFAEVEECERGWC